MFVLEIPSYFGKNDNSRLISIGFFTLKTLGFAQCVRNVEAAFEPKQIRSLAQQKLAS